jgi:hypothetical protein
MMLFILFTVWFILGLAGAYLVWLVDESFNFKFRRPTPRAILLGVLSGAAIGPVLLAIGIMFLAIGACFWINDNFLVGTWWTRPICRKQEDQ